MRKYPAVLCTLAATVFLSSFSLGQTNEKENPGTTPSVEISRPEITVSVKPNAATIESSGMLQFTASVKNAPNTAVKWSASLGTISNDGLYQAPDVPKDQAAVITATSVEDGKTFGQVAVLITGPEAAEGQNGADSGVTGSSKTIKQSFFGADFNGFGTWPGTDGQGKDATLGSLRLWDDSVKWSDINTKKGTYDWSKLDSRISKAQSAGLDVLYTIGDTPEWAGSVPKGSPCSTGEGKYSCSAPNDVNSDGTGSDDDFSNFITALVTRYKGEIAYYELWNEPDCTCFWSGTQAQLVRMGADAKSIITSIDKNATIVSPSAHGGTMKTWFDGYVAAGGAANFSIVNVHMRGAGSSNSDPEEFLTVYGDVTAETAKRNLTSMPIWDGEHGIKVGQMSNTDELAGYVARSLLLRAGVGLQRQYLYTWDGKFPVNLQGNSSGTAWNVVAGWLIGHTISACTESGKVYTCSLDDGLAVWDTSQTCGSKSCSTSNYTYASKYTHQTNLSGTKTKLSGKTVPIGYQPILLTEN